MSTSIMLVVVYFSYAPTIKIQEMPTMHMCESVGEWLQRSSPNVKYTCIENIN